VKIVLKVPGGESVGTRVRRYHQPSVGGGQIVVFNRLNLYHEPPDSGERQCKSRARKSDLMTLAVRVSSSVARAYQLNSYVSHPPTKLNSYISHPPTKLNSYVSHPVTKLKWNVSHTLTWAVRVLPEKNCARHKRR